MKIILIFIIFTFLACLQPAPVMVALCLDEGDIPNYHEDDIREAQKLVDDMDDSG